MFLRKNLALVFPTFPSGKQFSAMHGTNGILNFSADTDTVYSFALRNHAWRGKLKKVISVQYYDLICRSVIILPLDTMGALPETKNKHTGSTPRDKKYDYWEYYNIYYIYFIRITPRNQK